MAFHNFSINIACHDISTEQKSKYKESLLFSTFNNLTKDATALCDGKGQSNEE